MPAWFEYRVDEAAAPIKPLDLTFQYARDGIPRGIEAPLRFLDGSRRFSTMRTQAMARSTSACRYRGSDPRAYHQQRYGVTE